MHIILPCPERTATPQDLQFADAIAEPRRLLRRHAQVSLSHRLTFHSRGLAALAIQGSMSSILKGENSYAVSLQRRLVARDGLGGPRAAREVHAFQVQRAPCRIVCINGTISYESMTTYLCLVPCPTLRCCRSLTTQRHCIF